MEDFVEGLLKALRKRRGRAVEGLQRTWRNVALIQRKTSQIGANILIRLIHDPESQPGIHSFGGVLGVGSGSGISNGGISIRDGSA